MDRAKGKLWEWSLTEEMPREQEQEVRVLRRINSLSDIYRLQWSPLLPAPQCILYTQRQDLLVENSHGGFRDSNPG